MNGSAANLGDLTKLQFCILNAMMDDVEDLEQIYLSCNRTSFVAGKRQPEFPLREIVDGVLRLLESGHVSANVTNDERLAPLSRLNVRMLHYYWFAPTGKGQAAWENCKTLFAGCRT